MPSATSFFEKLTAGKPEGYLPVAPFMHLNFVKAFFQDENVDAVARTPEVYAHFGFDLIHRNCTPVFHPADAAGPDWTLEKEELGDGERSESRLVIRTPGGTLRQVSRRNRISAHDFEAGPIEFLIKDPADFELCRRFQPPSPKIDVGSVLRARKIVGPEGLVAPWVQGAFNFVAFFYCKLDDLLVYALTEETCYREMMEYFLQRNIECVDQILAAQPPLVSYAANIANAKLVSPDFFQKYVLEYEERLIRHIQSRGTGVLFHNCGYGTRLLPIYARLGMAAYESLTPPPFGDTRLAEALSIFPEETVLSGNLDQIEFLRTATPPQIEARTREILETVKRTGRRRFILAASDYFSEDTPHENVLAFSRAARAQG